MSRACENGACGHTAISYNSCMNRHCPKCQGAAAREWLAAREAELLPVQYFHQVFTLPAPIADIAYQNKAAIYAMLFKASAETMLNDRGRSQAPRGQDRLHRRAAHMGLGDDASSARAYDRAGRRAIAGWQPVDSLPARLLPAGAGALQAVPAADAREARSARTRPASCASLASMHTSPARTRSPPSWRRSERPSGSSIPSVRSPARKRCWRTCRATRTGLPSRTGAWSPLTRPASPSHTRTTASRGPAATRP